MKQYFISVFISLLFISPQFDVREDEEQNVKLGQTIDLLLAAGYFRARIKGLSPFDKVLTLKQRYCLVFASEQRSFSGVTYGLIYELIIFHFSAVNVGFNMDID